MITEDYVSFEIAKLLKEKGFDLYTYAYYEDEDNPNINIHASKAIKWNNTEFISKPTLQMAMKWLREIYKCCIVVYPEEPDDDSSTGCLWGLVISFRLHHQYTSEKLYESYEEGCEAAIRYCLENLI